MNLNILIKILVFWLLLVSLIGQVNAQENVEVFGYFESTFMGTELSGKYYQLNTNKLRVDLQSDISDEVSFAANFNYINYNGKKSWNILEFLSDDITSQVPEAMRGFYTIPFEDQHLLDNAYLKLALKRFDVTVGKQQISLGSGYVWNPTDVFNIKDPLDPTYEQPGHNAVLIDVPLGTAYSVSALYSPEESWEKSGKLIRIKGSISHFDIALLAIETQWIFHDYTKIDFSKLGFEELVQKRQLYGTSIAGELFGLGTWVEYAYNYMDNFDDFYELIVGTDYTFDFQTYVMFEYYRNMLGKTDYKKYDLNDWMRQFASEQKAISRDQLYALVQHPVTDFLTLGSSFIYSISDNSVAIVPTLNYSFAGNMDIMAYLNTNIGQTGTAYSQDSGSGGMIRARVFF